MTFPRKSIELTGVLNKQTREIFIHIPNVLQKAEERSPHFLGGCVTKNMKELLVRRNQIKSMN